MKFEWEEIFRSHNHVNLTMTMRAKVIGGWIVNSYTCIDKQHPCESMVFVPDAEHKWECKSE